MSSRPRTGLLLGGTLTLGVLVLGPAAAAVAANGQVCMGVVVDDGGYHGNGTVVQAAKVAPGSSDLQALQAVGDTVYQNDSGLVCGIDDANGAGEVPANGVQNCLATSGGEYYFWAYWEGDPYTNTWTYASIGPAEHTVGDGQTYVEGWSYQNPGPSSPSATKPSVSPASAFAQACPGVQPVPSGGSGGGGGSSGGAGSGGSGGGSTPVTPSPSAAPTTTTTTVAGTSSAAPPRTAAGNPVSSRTGATTTTSPGSAASAPPGATYGTSTTTSSGNATNHGDTHAALADARPHGTPGGGDPALPIVIVAAAIVLLGGLAWWRWRRRPAEE